LAPLDQTKTLVTQPPIAVCQDVQVNANANYEGIVSASDVDNGSSCAVPRITSRHFPPGIPTHRIWLEVLLKVAVATPWLVREGHTHPQRFSW
jgi:hypothetical protein